MKRVLFCLLVVGSALPLAGCGPKGDDYDPSKIAVKQPGDGPPPMARPDGNPPPPPPGP